MLPRHQCDPSANGRNLLPRPPLGESRSGGLGNAVPVDGDSKMHPPLGVAGARIGGAYRCQKVCGWGCCRRQYVPRFGFPPCKKARPKTTIDPASKGPSSDGPCWKFTPYSKDPCKPFASDYPVLVTRLPLHAVATLPREEGAWGALGTQPITTRVLPPNLVSSWPPAPGDSVALRRSKVHELHWEAAPYLTCWSLCLWMFC